MLTLRRNSALGVLFALSLVGSISSCSSDSNDSKPDETLSGGKANTGGSATGGSTGGTGTGGTGTGGTATGGAVATGGNASGGAPSGGGGSGGTTGGAATIAGGGSGGTTGGAQTAGGGSGGQPSAGNGGKANAGASGGGASGNAGAGGGGTAGGSGGTGGAVSFQPCPATGDCKILPLGDSITDGFTYLGAYRVSLFERATTDGKHITFVGREMNGPDKAGGVAFPRNHEGHSGWTVQQIDDITPSPALDPDPHIVLLHIGTNDMRNPSGAPDRLGKLIDAILMDLPNSLLVVSNIIPWPMQQSNVMAYNAAVPGIVKMRADAGKHILYVDQFKDFPENELQDGIHPNQTGYSRMAGVWYTAIKPYLP